MAFLKYFRGWNKHAGTVFPKKTEAAPVSLRK
jgi:hypothetical protein